MADEFLALDDVPKRQHGDLGSRPPYGKIFLGKFIKSVHAWQEVNEGVVRENRHGGSAQRAF